MVDTRAERHVYGAAAAPVVVVEFGDLECPHCRAAAPLLRTLVDESGGQVRLVWRHFPLFEVHPYALTAALASESAAAAGRFWDWHDTAIAHQDRLGDVDLRRYAAGLGLDPDDAVGEQAQKYAAAVEADYVAGLGLGVRGTPTLFVDGVRFEGPVELPALRAAVEAASRCHTLR